MSVRFLISALIFSCMIASSSQSGKKYVSTRYDESIAVAQDARQSISVDHTAIVTTMQMERVIANASSGGKGRSAINVSTWSLFRTVRETIERLSRIGER